MKNIKILVATHKKVSIPESDILLPIHVGSINSNLNLGIQRDDDGENISAKNNQYSELTAVYWAWKNLKKTDYIGLAHYRRMPSFRRSSIKNSLINNIRYIIYRFFYGPLIPGKETIKWHELITTRSRLSNNFDTLNLIDCQEKTMYVPRPIKFSNNSTKSYFNKFVSDELFKLTQELIAIYFPEIEMYYEKQLKSNKVYPCNIFIFNHLIFDEYSNFIFTILFELEKKLETLNVHLFPRTIGYIGEVLTSTFIFYKIKSRINVEYFRLLKISAD